MPLCQLANLDMRGLQRQEVQGVGIERMDRCQRLGALLWQHAPRAGVARIADDAFAERFTFDKTRDETYGQTIIDADRQHDQIGRATSELPTLIRISYALFCL